MPSATINLAALANLFSSDRFSADSSTCQRCQVDGAVPAAVVEPADAKELAEIVSWARAQHAALLPFTSGAYLPLGNPPAALDVGVSLRRLNHILHYDPGDLTLSVQAGIPLADVQKLLAEQNQFLPADPPLAERAALGGLLAANASGPLRYAYGTWRDFVVGLHFVTGEGKQVKSGGRVVKNVAGYDLTKLLIGSLGSLGILTEINFKVFPRPPETASFVAAFDTLETALDYRTRVVHSALGPTAIELLDASAARLLSAKHLSPSHWSLLISCGGVPAVIRRFQTDLDRLARELGAVTFTALVGEEEQATWTAVRNLVVSARADNPNATVIKCPLPLTQLGPFIKKVQQVAARYQLPTAVAAHAGTAIAFVYLLPAADTADAAQHMAQAATETIHAGNNLGGRVTLPWCPTEVKHNVNVWSPARDDFTLMQKLKAQFDPDRVLNPGRFVGGL